jgi:predicted PurR-regulated permease PerM
MVALNPSVTKLQSKTRLPRLFSIFIVYIFFILAVVGTASLVLPPLISEMVQLIKLIDIPLIQEHLAEIKFSLGEVSNLMNQFSTPANFIITAITSTVSSLFTFFTLLVLSFYLILERHQLYKKISWFSQKEVHLNTAKEFLDSVELQLGGWVRGELILMTVIGAMTFVGLTLLGIPYALPLAILAGLLEILPSMGPTISAVPAIAIATFQMEPWHGAAVLIVYIMIQQLENNFLVPKVMQTNAHIDPLPAILAILIGFELLGIMGGLLAVPAYIVIRTGFSTWKNLNQPITKKTS